MNHPSPYQLDCFAVGVQLAEVEAHLPCEQCDRHIRTVQADPGPVPPALLQRAPPQSRRWPFVAVALMAAMSLLLIRWPSEEPYIGVKGAAEVTVWVRSESEVSVWEGGPIGVGDSIRLEVQPGTHTHVEVLSGAEVLYRGAVTPGPLPVSWTVDGDGTEEILTVRLTGGPEPIETTIQLPKTP